MLLILRQNLIKAPKSTSQIIVQEHKRNKTSKFRRAVILCELFLACHMPSEHPLLSIPVQEPIWPSQLQHSPEPGNQQSEHKDASIYLIKVSHCFLSKGNIMQNQTTNLIQEAGHSATTLILLIAFTISQCCLYGTLR